MNEEKQKGADPKSDNKKAVIITIAATLAVVVLVGVAIFAIKKYNERKKELESLKKQMENLQKGAETTGEITVSGETGGTEIPPAEMPAACPKNFTNEENLNKADWKTASNAKNGYSFKYPKEWSITEKKDDYLQMGNAANNEYFEWRSGPMTGTDYMGYKEDSHKNISVGCQTAKITYLSGDPTADPPIDAKKRLILVQFEKNGTPHVIIFTYKYVGASISSDVVEMFDLLLKTVEFNK